MMLSSVIGKCRTRISRCSRRSARLSAAQSGVARLMAGETWCSDRSAGIG